MIHAEKIWLDGKLVGSKGATLHLLTHSLHYGDAVFEGTRAYKTDRGLAIFRLEDHTKRLLESAKITPLNCPFSQKELESAQTELLKANQFKENTYIRPLIFLDDGVMGLYHIKAPVRVGMTTWERGAYLGEEGLEKGIKVKISSFARNSVKSRMGRARTSANYPNSQIAKFEVTEAGYEGALMLDEEGFVAEETGECFFIVKNDTLITPPSDFSLKSIAQDMMLKIAHDLGIDVLRQRISCDEVYTADEAFLIGIAAEITPINNIDARIIGDGLREKLTRKIRDAYFDTVYGRNEKYASVLTYI